MIIFIASLRLVPLKVVGAIESMDQTDIGVKLSHTNRLETKTLIKAMCGGIGHQRAMVVVDRPLFDTKQRGIQA
jgi:hypothetical protein